MTEAIKFWLAKAVAEVIVWLSAVTAVLIVFGLVYGVSWLLAERRARRYKKSGRKP